MKKKTVIYTILQVTLILLVTFLSKKYIFNSVEVFGTSMEPTYHESDRLWQTGFTTPKRFDIITFPSPRNGKRIIKRVIGLPGETVRIENDQLYINDVSYDEPYLEQFKNEVTDNQPLTANFSLETIEKEATVVVPEGHYFVLGDNRRVADDSRYFGFVADDTIYGTVYFRYYPLDKIGPQ